MFKLFKIFTLLLTLSVSSALFAQDKKTENVEIETKLSVDNNVNRPRIPFPEEITCCYTNGQMSFSSSMGIDCMTVEITDLATGNTGYYTVLNENDFIPILLTQGSYIIICRTELNITYTGILDIP